LRSPALQVEVSEDTGLLRILDPASKQVLFAEAAVDADARRLEVHTAPEERFYGLGQKVRGAGDTSLCWNGRRREFGEFGNAREKSCPGISGQGDGNISVPMFLSTHGYGFFFDNHWRHSWSFEQEDAWSVESSGGTLRYLYIHGPRMDQVLERYTALTGRAPMPPLWALGLLQSKFGYRSWDEAEAAVTAYRAAGVPLDAVVLDLYWFGGAPHFGGRNRMGSLEWCETHFADAKQRIRRLREKGVRVCLIEEPYIDVATDNFREARDLGYLARKDGVPVLFDGWFGCCALLDVTNPDARRWWWEKHRALLEDGVAGWWADLGEPQVCDGAAAYHEGRTHPEVHNLYNLEWARALAEGHAADRPEERFVLITRSGYAGMQRYGAFLWSNDVMTDWEWLAPQTSAGLNLGLSGLPYWGTDVGGFIGPVASDELYTRWFQFGAFCPLFRPHGQDRPTAPHEFSPRTLEICRDFTRLRYRLLPYLYSAVRETHERGIPVMRPLVLEWPHDPEVHDLGDQFLFGPSLLVCPVITESSVRDVYLPEGTWYDFWTNEVHQGPVWLRGVAVPLERIPLFVRAGAILPLAPEVAHTGELSGKKLSLRVYPDATPSSYVLYQVRRKTPSVRAEI
jgi:alpha-glucosidase (family GH31 glycosyl hydrolase)